MWHLRIALMLALTLACVGCTAPASTIASGVKGNMPDVRSDVRQVQSAPGSVASAPAQKSGPVAASPAQSKFELVVGQARVLLGFVRIPVMVRNRSSQWADVVMGVELFDADDRPLVNRAATTAGEQIRSLYAVPPGGVMYYLYLRDLARLSGRFASSRVVLQDAYAAAPAGQAEVTIAEQVAARASYEGAPSYVARGTVRAITQCNQPMVVAGGFDAGNNLVDVAESLVYDERGRSAESLDELRPGQTGSFILEFLAPGVHSLQAVAVCLK